VRGLLWLMFVGVPAASFAGACGGSTTSDQTGWTEFAEGCVLDSDCRAPYACTFQRCHERCATTRDCPDGQRCVLTDADFHVCQLEAETSCAENSDCLGEQQCGSDAECRDACDAAKDCVDDQVCASDGSCAEPDEVDEGGNLPAVLGSGGSGGSGSGGVGGSAGEGSDGNAGAISTTGGTGGSTGGTSTMGTTEPVCGNGLLEGAEECDDGGTESSDGCSADCEIEAGWSCDGESTTCEDINECSNGSAECHLNARCHNEDGGFQCECRGGFVGDGFDCEDPCMDDPASCSLPVVQVVTGFDHACALFESGKVRCWGYPQHGALGYGNTTVIGDSELPTEDVPVGGTVVQLAAGSYHTCALLDNGKVRCWGEGDEGRLGYGNIEDIGDDELPAAAGDVDVGGTVRQIVAGGAHTCALLDSGAVRCWGYGLRGSLGYGDIADIGDDEAPSQAGDVELGGTATQIAAGERHTCAIMTSGGLKCWGFGSDGQLGYANTDDIGTAGTPAEVDEVDVGGEVAQVALGSSQTCALLTTGTVRCWGEGAYGVLGYGNEDDIGDDETPASAGDVPIGATVSAISCGGGVTCAVLEDGGVVCWGKDIYGVLGTGNADAYAHEGQVWIGDDETPDSLDPIVLGDTAEAVDIGSVHVCALTTSANVRCWGRSDAGRLGVGHASNDIGDDEDPSYWGPVRLL